MTITYPQPDHSYSGTCTPLEVLLDERELAEFVKVSLSCVRSWRLHKKGPKFVKIGGIVRYRMSDLLVHLADQTVETNTNKN